MKTIVFCFTTLLMFFTLGTYAQQENSLRIHQVGITFTSLNQFGINYKTGNEKTLLRLSLLSLNLRNQAEWGRPEDSLDVKTQGYGVGFRLGFEKRVPVVAHLDFIWGIEAGCNYSYNKQIAKAPYSNLERKDWNTTPLVNFIAGVNYTISDHLVIGAEITPGIQYSYGKTKTINNSQTVETTSSSFGFGFSSSSASLSLAYRFAK